ncbi:hypothetical protein ABMB44_14540 [Levilactobacillus brevis]
MTPERKDVEDVHVSKTERLNKAKFNIEHNGELSDQEKVAGTRQKFVAFNSEQRNKNSDKKN